MSIIKLNDLQAACRTVKGKSNAAKFYPFFDKYFNEYGISTVGDEAMFYAQTLHESMDFSRTRELGSHGYLDKYDTGKLAVALGNTPEDDDDGQKYCGRGLIQITGKYNYAAIAKDTGIDFLAKPELLEQPEYAVLSACWFWRKKNLSKICTDVHAVTRRINGGLNGLQERMDYWQKLLRAAA